ncbi:two-component regulator propeller domain-containing protein [Coprobacter tertius]|uniref:PorZ N-terminal beta-propeller domain-containing protein n=1 Tax=Coprobacter tertius TaxID=2944915 RepID=A0ABT1MD21_9BACT|nr:two-component regulator propeller domain-containing protein [Coprobacter tertius]MCP9610535.1 hypothetical protein [Coprobacter tertius]
MKRFFSILFFLIPVFSIWAQNAVGEWRLYPTYYTPTKIVVTPHYNYILADSSFLFSYDKDYDELRELSKQNILSDNVVNNMAYNNETGLLVITYSNGNIDLYIDNRTYNIPYIKNTSLKSKTINNISFYGDHIYLATDYGITVIDSKKKEIKDTYKFDKRILSTCIFNGNLMVGTEEETFAGKLTDNLLENSNFKFYTDVKPKYMISNEKRIIFLDIYNLIHSYDSENNYSFLESARGTKKIFPYKKGFIASNDEGFKIYDENNNLTYTVNYDDYEILKGNKIFDIFMTDNKLTALNEKGIYSYTFKNNEFTLEKKIDLSNNSIVTKPFNLLVNNGKLYVNSYGVNYMNTVQRINGNISILENGKWTNIDARNVPVFIKTDETFCTLSNIAVDPDNDNIFYVGTWLEGLYKFNNNEVETTYNATNSPIQQKNNHWQTNVGGVTFDKNKNLWMSNFAENSSLLVLKKDGTWVKLVYNDIKDQQYMNTIFIPEKSKTKWIISNRDVNISYRDKIMALNDNGTLENNNDDITRTFTSFTDQDGKQIENPNIICITEDKDGKLWIGTDQGPIVINNPDNFNSSDFHCNRVKIARNDGTNDADLLLSNDYIHRIAIDGGNRKWIATASSGVYLLSEDGTETIQHFTTQNSPLPSNTVYNIAIDPNSGEVYFATTEGLAMYRSDAIEPKEDFSNVYAFPNPVRPDFTGWITITGLQEKSLVKITDVSGNLIYQNYSEGGQLAWNGRTPDGNRVKTGIYLVFAANKEGKQGVVTKIMVVN